MTVRTEPWPAGTPCRVDISVPDLPAATALYSAVFGWEFTNAGEEYGKHHMARTGGHAAAGTGPIMQEGQPTVPSTTSVPWHTRPYRRGEASTCADRPVTAGGLSAKGVSCA